MPTNPNDTLLIFRIDCIPCAVVADSVQSILMPPEHLTQPPGSNRGRPGIFRHANHVFTVVDLRQRFGIDTPRQGAGRLLLHEHGNRRHALWVDEVVGLARTEEGQWAALPPYLPRSLFYSGFLYQQAIILCSTLDALLAMHDAEPIRRHLEQLRLSAKREESTVPEKAVDAPPAEIALSAPPESLPPPVEVRRPVSPPLSGITHHRPPTQPAVTTRPVTRTRPTPATTTSSRSTPTRPPHRAPLATRPEPARGHTPEREVHYPAEPARHSAPAVTAFTDRDNGNSHWPAWLLPALLLAAGAATGLYPYLTAPEKVITTKDYSTPPSKEAPSREAPGTTLPQAVATGTAPLASLPMAAPKVENGATAAVQIERDAEGTITMIIQRERLHAGSNAKLPPTETGTTPSAAEAGASRPATVPGKEEEGTDATPQDEAEWAEPAALPEPCDCTHIVVRGDTLWAIAEHYTNSAFNYPELARQSGIRNPHRIYPGNKVRIIVR